MDATRDLLRRAAIVGLGITETGKVYGHSAAEFAADAVRLAVAVGEVTRSADRRRSADRG